MEISDVLNALEELKNGIAAVKSANDNVERAATAARKVCDAFASCSSKLEGFPATVLEPIKGKVAEIADASTQMVKSCAESVDGLRRETKGITDTFNKAVVDSCNRIQNDISEFHKEIESFESKLSRMTSRVEEKTDGVVSEVRKLTGEIREDVKTKADAISGELHKASEGVSAKLQTLGSSLDVHGKDAAKRYEDIDGKMAACGKTLKAIKVALVILFVLLAGLVVALGPLFPKLWAKFFA